MKLVNTIKILSLFLAIMIQTNCEKKDELIMQMQCFGGASSIIAPADPGSYRIDAASENGFSSAFFIVTEDISNRVQNEKFIVNDQVMPSPVVTDPSAIVISDPITSVIIEYDMYLPGEEMYVLLPQGNTTLSVYKL